MTRRKSETRKQIEREESSRRNATLRRKAENRKRELGGITTGESMGENSITGYNVAPASLTPAHIAGGTNNLDTATGTISNEQIENDAVTGSKIDSSMDGGDMGSYRLRIVSAANGGSSQHTASANHAHSVGFKTNFTQEQRRELLREVQEMEAIDESTLDPAMRAMLRVTKRTTRMQIDDPEHTAEELLDFIDNGDPLKVHDWRMMHEQDYHTREMLLFDPLYRPTALTHPRVRAVAEELGVDYTQPVTPGDVRAREPVRFARRLELIKDPSILTEGRQHKPKRSGPQARRAADEL